MSDRAEHLAADDGHRWSTAHLRIDAGGRVTGWSDGATAIFGWPGADAVGRTLDQLELVHPDERGAVADTLAAVASGRLALGGLCQRNRTRDGADRYAEWTYTRVPGPGGGASARGAEARAEAEGASSAGRGERAGDARQAAWIDARAIDRTGFWHARQQRVELARQLDAARGLNLAGRALIDSQPALIAYIDRDRRYVHMNRSYQRWMGVDPAWAIGRTVEEVLGPAAEQVRAEMDRALGGEPIEFERELAYRDETPRWVRVTYTPDVNTDGTVRGLAVLVTDHSEQRRLRAALEARERRLGVLASLDRTILATFDPESIVRTGLDLLRQELGADRCAWADVEADENHFTFSGAALGPGVPEVGGRYAIAAFGAETLREMRSGRSHTWSDAAKPGGAGRIDENAYTSTGIRAAIVVPIMRGGRLVAGVGVHQLAPRAWTAEEVELAEAVTGRLIEAVERARAEASLRDSEERFRLAAQAVNGVVFDWDRRTGRVWRSDGLRPLVGFGPEECGPDAAWWYQRIHPDDLALIEPEHARLREPGGPDAYEVEYRVRHRDGHYVPVWERSAMVRDASGRVIRVVGKTADMTARKRAEAALQESESRFRAMSDSAPVLIWIAGSDGACTWFNRSWLEFTGRTIEQERGDGWAEGVHPDDLGRCLRIYREALAAREEFRMEYRLRRSDGAYRWILDHGRPQVAPDGIFAGFIGCCSDIHEVVEARTALEAQSQQLERLVEARTDELRESHARLRAAERLAALGTLSAGLGHDMGNLLLPVRLRLTNLSRMDLPAAARDELEAIRTATDYLQKLSAGLRLLAADPGRAPTGETPDVRAWWEESQGVFRNALPRGVELVHDLPDVACGMRISRTALTQAVFNLIQNAGEATRRQASGRVELRIEARGERVAVTVRDNGPGMTDEVRRRCLEPFFSTKTRGLSTGLGLALVHGLVRDAGGTIELTSQAGAGTTFTLLLPAAKSGPAAEVAVPIRRRALVRLADARVRGLVKAQLDSLGYEVAFEAAREGDGSAGSPDLLVTDEPAAVDAGVATGRVVLLTDGQVPVGAVAVGRRPRVQELRRALGADGPAGGNEVETTAD